MEFSVSCVPSPSHSRRSPGLMKPHLVVRNAPSSSPLPVISPARMVVPVRTFASVNRPADAPVVKLPAVNPGQAPAILSDLFPQTDMDGAATGFALAHIARKGLPVLWVQDRLSRSQAGGPCLAGLEGLSVLRVEANRPTDVLWSMEEGLRTAALGAVLGEIWGDPAVLNFTATKRLNMRAQESGVPVWMIRRGCGESLERGSNLGNGSSSSAARNRWRVASLPSAPPLYDTKAPGAPAWQVELFRSRELPTGRWVARYDRAAHRLHFSAFSGDGTLADHHQADGYRAAG